MRLAVGADHAPQLVPRPAGRRAGPRRSACSKRRRTGATRNGSALEHARQRGDRVARVRAQRLVEDHGEVLALDGAELHVVHGLHRVRRRSGRRAGSRPRSAMPSTGQARAHRVAREVARRSCAPRREAERRSASARANPPRSGRAARAASLRRAAARARGAPRRGRRPPRRAPLTPIAAPITVGARRELQHREAVERHVHLVDAARRARAPPARRAPRRSRPPRARSRGSGAAIARSR